MSMHFIQLWKKQWKGITTSFLFEIFFLIFLLVSTNSHFSTCDQFNKFENVAKPTLSLSMSWTWLKVQPMQYFAHEACELIHQTVWAIWMFSHFSWSALQSVGWVLGGLGCIQTHLSNKHARLGRNQDYRVTVDIVLGKMVRRTASNMELSIILLKDDIVLDKLDYYSLQTGVYVAQSNKNGPRWWLNEFSSSCRYDLTQIHLHTKCILMAIWAIMGDSGLRISK